MEFLCELIFEIILEGIFGLTVNNPKAKTWVKTAVFLLISEGVAGLILWISLSAFRDGNTSGGIVGMIVCAALAVGFLAGGIYGHKRDWKQDD